MNQASIDDFIDKLNTVPPEVSQTLHQIRQLDIEVLKHDTEMQALRETALSKAEQYANKKVPKLKSQIDDITKQISKKHQTIMKLSEEKVLLARKLYNCIDEPTEELDRDLVNQAKLQTHNIPAIKGKSKRVVKQNDWEYDVNEPCYCYCRRPSFGSMVMCQNLYCETEWFHMDCIQQKLLAQKWYCMDCRRSRQKRNLKFENNMIEKHK